MINKKKGKVDLWQLLEILYFPDFLFSLFVGESYWEPEDRTNICKEKLKPQDMVFAWKFPSTEWKTILYD